MKRATIKDRHSRVLGYIETLSDGAQRAMGPDFTIVGTYNPHKDVTLDIYDKVLSKGNSLVQVIDPGNLHEQ